MRTPHLLFGLLGLASAAIAPRAAAAEIDVGVHGGPMVLVHSDPETFAGDRITVGRGLGLGVSLRIGLSERFALEPGLELAWLSGQSYFGYTGSAGYAVVGTRLVFDVSPRLDLYGLVQVGGVAGGNGDGTPVFGVAGRLGGGARVMLWRWLGVFVEPRLSLFVPTDGSAPAPGFEVFGGPALLF